MALKRGVWIVIVLIFLAVCLSGLGMLLLVSLAGREPQVSANSTLVLRVGGDIPEMEPGGVLAPFIEGTPTVRAFVDMLQHAKTDKRITSVILKPTGEASLWGKVQEVRDAVADFRRSGKPIVAYMEYGGEQEFYLATACSKVFLMPTSTLDLTGMASYELFLRGTLDKIGAYPDGMHIGEYKTALNTFTQKTYTPAHREMAESLNSDLYDQLVRGIADGRHKSETDVKSLIDHGPFLPEDALRAGLIDDLAYDDEIEGKLKLPGKTHMLDMNDYRQTLGDTSGRGQRIAVIYASGLIASGKSSYDATGSEVIGADTLVEYLRKARADSTIKAIVLRVDSPGGSAIASDVIWREVYLTKKMKPVVASMSDVAASGGYYIAMPSDAIVAEPSTLTGSIGVVMEKFVIDGTLKKLGMNMEGVSRGKYADLYSPVRPFSPDERARMESYMQATYDTFVEKAAQGRNTTPEKIDEVGQGRVWTGRQAKQIGLVDDLGGLDRAVALAKQRAKIAQDADVELVVYPPKKSFYDVLTNPLGANDRAGTLASLLGIGTPRVLQALAAPLQVFRHGEPLAIMPNVFIH
jgi:protease-4